MKKGPSASSPPPLIVLTGGIGSGKTTVAEELRLLGAQIIDADELAREVVLPGTPGFKAVADTFGAQILHPDGTLDRKSLGAIVFNSPAQRKTLEKILHPLIRARFVERRNALSKSSAKLIVYVVPLYFEAQLQIPDLRAVVVVRASPETCVQRIVARDAVSPDFAHKQVATQMPIADKCARADFVLDNDSPNTNLAAAVKNLFERLTS